MREVLDVNVIALVLCTKFAVKSMKERQVNDGHIFNISRYKIGNKSYKWQILSGTDKAMHLLILNFIS